MLWISLLVIILDQITKQLALNSLSLHQAVNVIPGFDWYLTYNRGAAFSFLAQAGGWQRWFFTITTIVISAVILFWIKRVPPEDKFTSVSLCLILGGAIGNLIIVFYWVTSSISFRSGLEAIPGPHSILPMRRFL